MEEMRVKVMHPTDNSVANIAIEDPDHMTIQDIIEELIESGFIERAQQGYQAVLKDGPEAINMDLNKTLEENNATNNSTIRLISGIPAGGDLLDFERSTW